MVETAKMRTGGWRWLGWGGALAVLAVPAVAMLFTDAVRWTPLDFIAMGAIVVTLAAIFDFLVRRSGQVAYRLAAGLALAAAFLLIWVNLAVGIVGDTDNPANLLFACVVVAGGAGAVGAGFAPDGMARAMLAAATIQALILPVVLTGPAAAREGPAWVWAITALTLALTAMWLVAGWLFRRAHRGG